MGFEEYLNQARARVSRLPKGSQITADFLRPLMPILAESILEALSREGYLEKKGSVLNKRYKVR